MRLGQAALAFVFIVDSVVAPQSGPISGGQAATIPNPEMFYRQVRDNLARAQQASRLYSYKERRSDLHTNLFGKMGTDGSNVFQVYPSLNPQLTYRQLIERNGRPVSAEELARQDREYRTKVAELQRRRTREDEDDRKRREQDEALTRRRAQLMIDDVVDALQFRIGRRETYEGQPAVVVTFAPKAKWTPKTREGRIAQHFVGTVWVHETLKEVMRVEAKAIDDISFGFLVAKLNEGTTASLTRRPLEHDLWMPTNLRLTGEGRAILFRRVTVNYAVEWFDYQKMNPTSPNARESRNEVFQ
jgi:hypothetical protein